MTGPSGARRPILIRRPSWAVSIGLGMVVVGFVGAAQWNSSIARQQFSSSAQQVLAAQVVDLEEEQRELREQIAEAEDEVQRFQEETSTSSASLAEVNRALAAARLAAGLVPVTGPGAIVEIADSLRVVPPGENPAGFIVLVDDLRDIVAGLWASGAEAIAINGERVVATTSVYGVGASILVNTAFLSPPFRVEAIGPEGLLDAFLASAEYRARVAQRIEVFGLEFATQAADALELPAFVGSTRLRWAVPTAEIP